MKKYIHFFTSLDSLLSVEHEFFSRMMIELLGGVRAPFQVQSL